MAVSVFEIPLVPSTPQRFSVALRGITYQLAISWNWVLQAWVLDLYDANANPLVRGIPMLTGVDLLGQYLHLGIGGALFIQNDDDPSGVPSFGDLGVLDHLFFAVQT